MSSEKKNKQGSGNFEEDLSKLEEIVTALEAGRLPLDEALRQFEAGVGLVRRCEKTLNDAERKIEILVRGMDGSVETQPFDENAVGEESESASVSSRPTATRKTAPKTETVDEVPATDTEEEDAGDELF